MKYKNFLLSALLLLLLGGCATYPEYQESDFNIQFGLLSKSASGAWEIEPTTEIPYVIGERNQKHGYLITPIKNQRYKFYAVMHMPADPVTLEGNIVSTKSQATTGEGLKSILVYGNGVDVMDAWFTTGDPKGEYNMQLFINDSLAADTIFIVE